MKKLLCMFLALTMVLSSFTFVLADDYGKTHLRNPVKISTVNDLKNLAAIVNSDVFGCEGETFVLTNDLDLGGEAWNRWIMGTLENPFKGTFDGNGYVIKNFSMNCDAKIGYGLFGVVGGNGVIKNLGIEKATAKATDWSEAYGGAVGILTDNATVKNCYAKEVKPTSTVNYMISGGGLVGTVNGEGAVIENCYAIDCDMEDGPVDHDGGIAGRVDGCARIENCYSNTNLFRVNNDGDKITNCYYGGNAHWPQETYIGTKVTDDALKTLADDLGNAFIEGTSKTNYYPALSWQEIEVEETFGATGSATIINSVAQLQAISSYATTEGMTFKLGADIDLGGMDWNDFVIGSESRPFKGTFNGNGHVIKNYKFKSTSAKGQRIGLFGVVGGNGIIKNLGIENIEVYYGFYGPEYTNSYYAGLAAVVTDNATIDSCYSKNFTINTKDPSHTEAWSGWGSGEQPDLGAGLIANVNGAGVTVSNCYALGFNEVNDSCSTEAGVIGMLSSAKEIKNCYSEKVLGTTAINDDSLRALVTNSYCTDYGWYSGSRHMGTKITDAELKGKAADLGSAYVANAAGYPQLSWEVNPLDDGGEGETEKPVIPSGAAMTGAGTIDNPYVLTAANHILELAAMDSTAGKYFSLANDIDVNSAVITDTIDNFEGYFDGNGYEIKNFELNANGNTGLFGNIAGDAKITDLGIKNVNIVANDKNAVAGGLVGLMEGGAVTNCYVRNLWFNSGEYAVGGGLIGKMNGGSVVDCYASGVAGLTFVTTGAGLIGNVIAATEVVNCYSDTTLAKSSLSSKFENTFQMEDSSGYNATFTDKLGYDFANAFAPTKTMGPKLKTEIFGDYVNLIYVDYTSDGATYSVDVEKDAYYRISAMKNLSGVTFDGTALDLNGGTAVYAKATATKTATVSVAGTSIKNLRITKVNIDAEIAEAEGTIVLDAPINKAIDFDFEIPVLKDVCGGLYIEYTSENGLVDEDGYVSADVAGYGVANDTFTATAVLADKVVSKSIEIGIKEKAPYEILNAGLVNENGDTVYNIKKAVKIDTVYVNKNTADDYSLFMALYKGDKLVKLAKGENNGTAFKFDITTDGADKAKAYVIDENSVQPVALPYETFKPTSSTDKITVHTVGDSLVQTYNPLETDLVGWGQLLGSKLSVDNVTVDNSLSRSGMYAKEFIELGRLNNLLKKLKAGDYVLIQLSINDMYQGIPINSFKAQMNQIISGVIEKGAYPVLITSPDMIKDGTATNTKSGGKYVVNSTITRQVNTVREIAMERQIPLIDHTAISHELFAKLGYDGVKALGIYVADELHYNEKGSEWITNNIATGLVELGLPLGDFVIDVTGVYPFEEGAVDDSDSALRTDYIGIDDITSVEIGDGYQLSWYAYDENKEYIGTSGWLNAGKEFSTAEVKKVYTNAKYIKISIKKTSGSISVNDATGVKITKGYGVTRYTYEGSSLNTNNELSYEYQFKGTGGQDGAIYGDYLFRFGPKGEGVVYSIDNKAQVGTITLDKKDVINPHSNAVHFGSEFYAAGDEFPLLYSTLCDNAEDSTTVYRVVRNGNTFTTTLVQVITAEGTNDAVVDAENNMYYAYLGPDVGRTGYRKYALPKLADGTYNSTYGVKHVVLTENDVLAEVDFKEDIYIIQGSTIYDGKMYLTSGFTLDQVYLTVYDLETDQWFCKINLEEIGLSEESEFIAFKDDVMYLMPVYGNIYTFKFY